MTRENTPLLHDLALHHPSPGHLAALVGLLEGVHSPEPSSLTKSKREILGGCATVFFIVNVQRLCLPH
jgi:hypothetical protein